MDTKRLSRFALLTALAMVLSWLEHLIPLPAALPPGIKLGLTNLVVLFALYRMSFRDAAIINVVRVILVTFTFGNAYALAYSLMGAALSLPAMALLKRTGKFSPVGVSVAGGVCHNLGQILVAMVVLEDRGLLVYLPVLMVSGVAAGAAVGIVGGLLVQRIQKL